MEKEGLILIPIGWAVLGYGLYEKEIKPLEGFMCLVISLLLAYGTTISNHYYLYCLIPICLLDGYLILKVFKGNQVI